MSEHKKSTLEGRYLTFYVDNELYGLALSNVIEIVSAQPTAHLPHVPAYIRGVINLRGRIVPVLDVRLKLKKDRKQDDEKTCFIIVAFNELRVGVIVDEVAEVCSIADHQLSEPPLQQLSEEKYLQSIANLGDRVVRNLDCERFFGADLYADGIRPASSQEEG